jgi:hypothetical protein
VLYAPAQVGTTPTDWKPGSHDLREATKALFHPYEVGPITLKNRIVMAPLTRSRAGPGGCVTNLNAEYYGQPTRSAERIGLLPGSPDRIYDGFAVTCTLSAIGCQSGSRRGDDSAVCSYAALVNEF